jgi:hypothetical protein
MNDILLYPFWNRKLVGHVIRSYGEFFIFTSNCRSRFSVQIQYMYMYDIETAAGKEMAAEWEGYQIWRILKHGAWGIFCTVFVGIDTRFLL